MSVKIPISGPKKYPPKSDKKPDIKDYSSANYFAQKANGGKKPHGPKDKGPTTVVRSGNTTITTKGKTTINIFNSTKTGNVRYKNNYYSVFPQTWAGPNPSMPMMPMMPMMPAYGNGCGGCGNTGYTDFEKAMIALGTVGPGNAASLVGGLLNGLFGSDSKSSSNGSRSIGGNNSSNSYAKQYPEIEGYEDLDAVNNYNDAVGDRSSLSDDAYNASKDVIAEKNNVAKKEKAKNTAEANVDTAQKDYDKADKAHSDAKNELADLESKLSSMSEGDEGYAELKKQVDAKKEEVEKLKGELDKAKENLDDKKEARNKAQSELDEANRDLKKADGKLATAEKKLNDYDKNTIKPKREAAERAIRIAQGKNPEVTSSSGNDTTTTDKTEKSASTNVTPTPKSTSTESNDSKYSNFTMDELLDKRVNAINNAIVLRIKKTDNKAAFTPDDQKALDQYNKTVDEIEAAIKDKKGEKKTLNVET